MSHIPSSGVVRGLALPSRFLFTLLYSTSLPQLTSQFLPAPLSLPSFMFRSDHELTLRPLRLWFFSPPFTLMSGLSCWGQCVFKACSELEGIGCGGLRHRDCAHRLMSQKLGRALVMLELALVMWLLQL